MRVLSKHVYLSHLAEKKMYGVTNKAFTYEKGKIDQTSYSKITLVNKNGNYLSCSGEEIYYSARNDKTETFF